MKKEIIAKIENLTREKGFIYSLTWILSRDLFFDPEEAADIDWHSRLSYQELSFLIGLMVKNTLPIELIDKSTSKNQVKRTYQFFQELHHAFMEPVMKHLYKAIERREVLKNDDESKKSIFEAENAMAEPIFYGGSGAYDFQFLNFASKRYQKDSEWLHKNKGFQIETAVAICKKLKKLQVSKYANTPKPESFVEFCRTVLSIFCFTTENLQEFPSEEVANILKTFSVIPGTVNKDLSLPGKYNVVNSHPLVILNENLYFVPVLFNFAQSIYESPFYWMWLDKKYIDTSSKNRGEATVNIAHELLVKVFGENNVYKQVNIEKSKKKRLTDIDLLAVTGNKAIVFQIKSKKLTLLSRTGDEEKLKQDFIKAVQDSYNQAIVSRKAILEKESYLIDSAGHEVKLDDSLNDVYILCVTSDDYPAVTFQTRMFLKKKSADPYPITINLFDLDILTYYLKDPFNFLYYMRQRIDLYDCFVGQSEIDLLAYHLNKKLYPLEDEKSGKSIDMVMVDSMSQLIDAHFPAACGYQPKTKTMDKLFAKWSNPEFQEIIDQLKKSKQSGFTDAIFLLYDLAGCGADQFMDQVRKLKDKSLREKKSLRFYMTSKGMNDGISYICDYENNGRLLRHVMEYCQIKKYQMKSEIFLGLGGIATSPHYFEASAFNKDPWRYDPKLEELSKKYFTKGKLVSLKSGEKIGRNDPCYCGSGRKYKNCCGR